MNVLFKNSLFLNFNKLNLTGITKRNLNRLTNHQ